MCLMCSRDEKQELSMNRDASKSALDQTTVVNTPARSSSAIVREWDPDAKDDSRHTLREQCCRTTYLIIFGPSIVLDHGLSEEAFTDKEVSLACI